MTDTTAQRDALLVALEGLVERHLLLKATGPTAEHFAEALTVAQYVITDIRGAAMAAPAYVGQLARPATP